MIMYADIKFQICKALVNKTLTWASKMSFGMASTNIGR